MDKIALVLCGGDINYSHLPIITTKSNAMIPVNGKPVIGWIMEDLEEKDIKEVILVLRFDNVRLFNYIDWAFSRRFIIHYAFVQSGGTILHSLLSGLAWIKPDRGVHIVLGDTLVRDKLPMAEDFVFAGNYENPEDWCLVEMDHDGFITAYWDKQLIRSESRKALAGVYSLSNADFLRILLIEQIRKGSKEISQVLSEYGKALPIKAITADRWFDFGHINDFNQAKRELLQSRYFNSLSIDSLRGTISKSSTKTQKLADELNWYESLPRHLQMLAPRTSRDGSSNQLVLEQEFYGYPNLAELFVFGDIGLSIWHNAIDQLMKVHGLLRKETGLVNPADVREMYWTKTKDRLSQLNKIKFWQTLLNKPKIKIGGKEFKNISALEPGIRNEIDGLASTVQGSIIHGDYCFSNILYDLNSQLVRLIDPRGSFGSQGIYGDPRYDMAKLRHSVSGLYDFILADLFKVSGDEGSYELELFKPERYAALVQYFDEQLVKNNYKLSEIKLIEGLLFVSMVPYHEGKLDRQLAMYLNGIVILNDVLNHENSN